MAELVKVVSTYCGMDLPVTDGQASEIFGSSSAVVLEQ